MATANRSFRVVQTLLSAGGRPRAPILMTRSATRLYSSDDAPPPLLTKLKGDIKAAMRAKDAQRLAVLRAVTSAALNASKTASPIRTDVQMVALLRKTQRASLDAAAEFAAAGRADLATKEEEQAAILQGYVDDSGVKTLGEAELRTLVEEAVAQAKGAGVAAKGLVGDVMKRLSAKLEGIDVDKKELASLIKSATS